jgi:hypothetical protein
MRRNSLRAMVSAVPYGGPEEGVHAAEHHREHDTEGDADARHGVGIRVGEILH